MNPACDNRGPTVAALRDALAPYFTRVDLDAYFAAMVVSGLLPFDKGGGAPINPRQMAIALIAISTGADPISAPEQALRVAGAKLRCLTRWVSGPGYVSYPIALPEEFVPDFWTFVEQQIEAERGALPAGHPLTFVVLDDGAAVQIPLERGGGVLEFGPRRTGPCGEPGPGINGRILEIVAALFEPIAQQEIAPALTQMAANVLGLAEFGATHMGNGHWH